MVVSSLRRAGCGPRPAPLRCLLTAAAAASFIMGGPAGFAGKAAAALRISEFLASNEDSIKDEDGDRSDWIELLNSGTEPVNLAGYYLTDDAAKPKKWPCPAVALPAGGTLIVWASEKDRRAAGAPLHTNFKLSAGGEYLALRRDDPGDNGETVAEHEFAPVYPPQYEDVSCGLGQQNTILTLVTSGTPARRYIPSNDSLDVKEGLNPGTWIATGFNHNAWTACTVPVGYGRESSDPYDAIVTPGSPSDTESAMYNAGRVSCYLRIPFTLANAGAVQSLTLRVRADDGFAAYLNGVPVPVADEVAPDPLMWNSTARWEPTDTEALTWREYTLPASTVQTGGNVLCLHGVNASSGNNDFLLDAELTATTSDSTLTGAILYFRQPTPGTPNLGGTANPGPVIADVPRTLPPAPASGPAGLVITARVLPTAYAVAQVSLKWRLNQGTETTVEMRDDATGGDALAGDGIHSAAITTASGSAGSLIRWRVTATDAAPQPVTVTDPPYPDPRDSPQYWGTIRDNPGLATSRLPVLHWFTSNASGAGTNAGSSGSLYYQGEFYDNVRFSLHGQSTAAFSKKSHDIDFNHDFHFRYAEGQKRVKDINLLSNWADKSKLRTTLAYDAHRRAGQAALFAFPVRVQQNGAFFSISDLVEEGNEDYLERAGLDPEGALYKMYNTLDSAFSGIEKKTRQWEGNSDLNTLITQLNPSNALAARRRWGYDNVDIPDVLNYLAVSALILNNDQGHKNYYLYRDYRDARQWKLLPWDVDLSFGHTWTGTDAPTYGAAYFDDHIDSQRGLRLGNTHRLKSLIYDSPELNRLFVRRLRTLMDEWLVSASSETGYFETFGAGLLDQLDPPGLGNASDSWLDGSKWGFWTMTTNTGASNSAVQRSISDSLWPSYTVRKMAGRIFDPSGNGSPYPSSASYSGLGNTDTRPAFLKGRRTALYGTGSSTYSGGERIPAAQPATPAIAFGAMLVNPGAAGQKQEYLTLRNNAGTSIDLSGWTLDGGPGYHFTLPGGTVVPPWTTGAENIGLLFVARSPVDFRARTTAPMANQFCYTVGGYDGQLTARGQRLELRKPDGTLIAATDTAAAPSPLQQSLRISEIMPAPAGPTPAETALNPVWKASDFEYLELVNTGSTALDLGGASFTAGVSYLFPAGVTLAPGTRLIVPGSAEAFAARHDPGATGLPARAPGEFSGDLSNTGETIRLEDASGEIVLEFNYDPAWAWPAAEAGHALETADPAATPWDQWGSPARWTATAAAGGTPGSAPSPEASGAAIYETWKFTSFPEAQWSDPALTGAAADSDRDGTVNLAEYALGMDPARPDAPGLMAGTVTVEGTVYPALTFRRRARLLDAVCQPQISGSLAPDSWQSLTVLHHPPAALPGGVEEVTYRSTAPLASAPRQFMRVKISALRGIP